MRNDKLNFFQFYFKFKMSNSALSTFIHPNQKYSNSYKKYVFEYKRDEHYLYVYDSNKNPVFYETPYFKVYRNLHQHLDKWYLVLEISNEDEEDDVNSEIHNFKSMLDKIYGQSHEFIRKNFSTIFPKAQGVIDKYTLDTCIIRPFAGSNAQFIKILIPTEELAKKANELKYEQDVKCTFIYNGLLKMKGGKLMEEYILYDIQTYEQWSIDEIKRSMSQYGSKYEIEIVKEEVLKNDKKDETHVEINKDEDTDDNIEVESIIIHDENEENHENQENGENIIESTITQTLEEIEVKMENEKNEGVEEKIEKDENINVNQNENRIEYMDGVLENKEKIKEDKESKKEKSKHKKNKELKKEDERKHKDKDKEKEKKKKDKLKKKLSSHKKSKKEETESDLSDEDNLSDNEEFHNLTEDMKKMIRKFR